MKLPRLFSDGMVVQQGLPIPVWGWAKPLQRIQVTLAAGTAETQADAKGTWMVKLPKMRAADHRASPLTLRIFADEETQVANVLVGEVWLCAGEAAMHMPLDRSDGGESAVAAAQHPLLRLFQVGRAGAPRPADDVQASAAWQICTSAHAASFSAISYHFGHELLRSLDIPIGLIQATWGQTMAEAWTSRAALASESALGAILRRIEMAGTLPKPDAADYKRKVTTWQNKVFQRDPGNKGSRRGWHTQEIADDQWPTLPQPGSWQSHGLPGNGSVWLRRHVTLPKEWRGKALTLSLGPIADFDTTYVNGVIVGSNGANVSGATKTTKPAAKKNAAKTAATTAAVTAAPVPETDVVCPEAAPRVYEIPGSLVKGGDTLIAIRVFNQVAAGGLLGSPAQMWLALRDAPGASGAPAKGATLQGGAVSRVRGKTGRTGRLSATTSAGAGHTTKIALAGPWSYQVEVQLDPPARIPPPPLHHAHHDIPATISNAMIQPLVPYGLRGVLWYQGVSNVDRAVQYRTLLSTLIKDWRIAWGQGDFPFGIVQLPGHTAVPSRPAEKPGTKQPDSAWAELREAQALAGIQPRNGLAVTIDLPSSHAHASGEQAEIARRLALWALGDIYQQTQSWHGPQLQSTQAEGSRIRLTFSPGQGGLTCAPAAQVHGFTIAGHDRKFHAADAIIDGDTILVQSPQVKSPVAVRYAWADRPDATLRNGTGLPAAPFRTDSWELSTQTMR